MLKTDVAELLLDKYGKKNPPAVKPGDTVRVYQKIKEGEKERVQIFEGLVIAVKHGRGLDGSFTVRKIAVGGIGVERTYPLHSPNVVKVERTKTAKVSRAKLFYMRDRKGKTARFKNEGASPMTWEEPAAPVVVEEATENVITEEIVDEMIEPTVDASSATKVATETEAAAEEVAVETENVPMTEEMVQEALETPVEEPSEEPTETPSEESTKIADSDTDEEKTA